MRIAWFRSVLPTVILFASLISPALPLSALRLTPADPLHSEKMRLFAVRVAQIDAPPSAVAKLDRGESEAVHSTTREGADSNALATDSRVVFQSYRDGNWEVYRANGDLGGQNNATGNPAADIRPELSFNGQKIAFVSNRTGNFEIFVMNWDGSGLIQMTNSPGIDSSPSFAPDGRIAFISNRDGNQEMYVMNGDGSGLRRITSTPEHEYGPAVSIDGRMSWARAQANSNVGMLVMTDHDGAQPVDKTSLPYMSSPVWSHDGKFIAYDGDANGDNWNDLMVAYLANGEFSTSMAYSPGQPLIDVWSSTWSPNDNEIWFTRVDYGQNGQQLVKLASYVESIPYASVVVSRVTTLGLDELPDARWNDSQAPSSRVPPTSVWFHLTHSSQRNGWFTPDDYVSWNGLDHGPAGIAFYEIQYRIGKPGPWVSWLRTSELGKQLKANNYGGSVYFRSQAIDKAGNTENWPASEDGDISTILYAWSWDIRVTDSRITPLSGVSASIDPQQINLADATDDNGERRFFFASFPSPWPQIGTSAYFTSFLSAEAGYATGQRAIRLFMGMPYQGVFRPYLWDPDNIIRNGSFEEGLSGWEYEAGTSPLLVDPIISSIHFGQFALAMKYYSAISQTVFLSPTLHKPTLAFMTDSRGSIQVSITDGVSKTILNTEYDPNISISPIHHWVDKTPWKGRTVTITLRVYDDANILDDVTLSSWNTPVISDVSSRLIQARDVPTPITISGTNFISTPVVLLDSIPLTAVTRISEDQVSAIIPAGAPVGLHNLTVINPGGQAGTLQRAIRVGVPVYLPITGLND